VETPYRDDYSSFNISLITPIQIPTTLWLTSEQHASITSLQIGAFVLIELANSAEMLKRFREKMAGSYLGIDVHAMDIEQLDFVCIFDLDEDQDFFSNHRMIDIGRVMARIVGLVEKTMIADQIRSSLLQTCTFQHSTHTVAALTAPSADSETNFERLEFLGDVVLRMMLSAQIFTDHINWPAGWLSQYRATLASNSSLANAAFSVHLDCYIMTTVPKTRMVALPRISDSNRSAKLVVGP
jgi:hypothetical protein